MARWHHARNRSMSKLADRGSITLFNGERVARRSHFCDRCGREICAGERYTTKVILLLDRTIIQTKVCTCPKY